MIGYAVFSPLKGSIGNQHNLYTVVINPRHNYFAQRGSSKLKFVLPVFRFIKIILH